MKLFNKKKYVMWEDIVDDLIDKEKWVDNLEVYEK